MQPKTSDNQTCNFRKRPVVIEAHRWMQHDDAASAAFGNDSMARWLGNSYHHIDSRGKLLISTLEGVIEATYGDWIVKGVKGEFYPVKPDIFEATYERVR